MSVPNGGAIAPPAKHHAEPDRPELFVPTIKVTFKVDTTALTAALERAGRAFAKFARAMSPQFARAQQILREQRCREIRIAYRARARRRTRSHR